MCYRTGEYTVCRRVRASFSPEILKAVAVKGLPKFFGVVDLLLFCPNACESQRDCQKQEAEEVVYFLRKQQQQKQTNKQHQQQP